MKAKLQRWLLRKIFKELFTQGPSHLTNVAHVYQLIRDTWRSEFTEDNSATTDAMLRDAFNATQTDVKPEEFTLVTSQLIRKLMEDKGWVFDDLTL
jgi:hypothetical protein